MREERIIIRTTEEVRARWRYLFARSRLPSYHDFTVSLLDLYETLAKNYGEWDPEKLLARVLYGYPVA